MYKKQKMPIVTLKGGNIIIDVPSEKVKDRILLNADKLFTNDKKLPMPILKVGNINVSEDDKKCSPIAIFKNGSCIPTPIIIDLVNKL